MDNTGSGKKNLMNYTVDAFAVAIEVVATIDDGDQDDFSDFGSYNRCTRFVNVLAPRKEWAFALETLCK